MSIFSTLRREAAGGRLRYYDDEDLFARLVISYRDAGYTDIDLYYPVHPSQLEAFERIAQQVIPSLAGTT